MAGVNGYEWCEGGVGIDGEIAHRTASALPLATLRGQCAVHVSSQREQERSRRLRLVATPIAGGNDTMNVIMTLVITIYNVGYKKVTMEKKP